MPYASVDRKRCACQSTCRASLARPCDRDSKSAVCIIFTHAKLPDRKRLPNARVKMQNDPCARLLCEVQFFAEGRSPAGRLIRDIRQLSTAYFAEGRPTEFSAGTSDGGSIRLGSRCVR